LDLRVVASDPALPPRVVSTFATSQEIVVSFNKPMDPISASNVNNYAVFSVTDKPHTFGGVIGFALGATRYSLTVKSLRLQSAQYDPTTQSVTLVPMHGHLGVGLFTTVAQVRPRRSPVRPVPPSNVAPGLTDLQGNPINADTTPGKVELRLNNASLIGGL
jgi:hypothetical protein